MTAGAAGILGAALAAAFALKVAEMKAIDNGNGVLWAFSWPQIAALLAAVPGGPMGVTAAAMVFIHPTRL